MSKSTKAGSNYSPVPIAELEAFISSALATVGIPAVDAAQVAELMAVRRARWGCPWHLPVAAVRDLNRKRRDQCAA
jgi:hypothetical protein